MGAGWDLRLFSSEITMRTQRRSTISLDALVKCFDLNLGELEQLEAWMYHYPDLLREVEPGFYATEPAIQAVKNVLRLSRASEDSALPPRRH